MRVLMLVSVILSAVNGFGYVGHRIISRLVWQLVDTHTKSQLEEHFGRKTIFLQLSSWPDQIKFDFAWKWTSKFHFANSLDNPPHCCQLVPGDLEDKDNLLSAVKKFYNDLRGDYFVTNLSFLIHFIGDLHQPLHVTSKDHGGTRHYLRFNGKRVPLHLLYDTLMINDMLKAVSGSEEDFALSLLESSGQPSYNMGQFKHCDNPIEICALKWAQDANQLNCDVVFKEDTDISEHKQAVKRQLLLAALRIAHLLNSLFEDVQSK
jgi:hypothetical protein